ncbi:putative leucine-rich repeat domain superfamily [Helianthus annuus]|nr:putative leucine-rich repeat domain superfamily [Helianthus annuus]
MQVLVLRGNKLNGTLLTSNTKSPFQKLGFLDLSSNEFSGLLPSNYFKNFKAMMAVEKAASGDLYMGEDYMYDDTVVLVVKGLSSELKRILVIFTTIDLSVNKFEDEIPDTIGKLRSLRFLNLSHNSLSDSIPTHLSNLVLLQH